LLLRLSRAHSDLVFAIIQTTERRQSCDGRHDVKEPVRDQGTFEDQKPGRAPCHVDESWGTSRPARCTAETTRAFLTQQLQHSSPAKQKTIASQTINLRHLFHSVSLLGPQSLLCLSFNKSCVSQRVSFRFLIPANSPSIDRLLIRPAVLVCSA
jgi:hypothetical protein